MSLDPSLEALRGLLPDSEIETMAAMLARASSPRELRRWLREIDREEAEVQAIETADRRLRDRS